MSYVFDITLAGPTFQMGRMEGFEDRSPDLHRRAEISNVVRNGGWLLGTVIG